MKKTIRKTKFNEKLDYPISVRLTKGLKIRLETFSKYTGISKSQIIQNALEGFLKQNEDIK